MTDGISIDPQAIIRGANDLDAVRDQLRATAGDAITKIAGIDAFWGDDHVGQQFANAYTPNAKALADSVHQLVSALDNGAQALRQQALQWEQAERQNTATAKSVDSATSG
jgi:hypothetical protein